MGRRWIDETGGFDAEAHAEWMKTWGPRCPVGHSQRVRRCLGYREREPGRLQLRVALGGTEGVCEIPFVETPETVYVRILVCHEEDDEDEREIDRREYTNCPVHICLKQPLGERTVYDVHTEQEVRLFVPDW